MDPAYVFEGYEIDDPWVIVIGVAMDHDELNKAPDTLDDPSSGVEVGRQYNRARAGLPHAGEPHPRARAQPPRPIPARGRRR